MIKFKHTGNGQFIRYSTDENGDKIPGTETASFSENSKKYTSGAGDHAAMLEWLKIPGNEIEPQFTPEEMEANEAEAEELAKVAYVGLRRSAYNEAGLTFDAWNELVIEKNTAGQTAYRAKRDVIRSEIPKT